MARTDTIATLVDRVGGMNRVGRMRTSGARDRERTAATRAAPIAVALIASACASTAFDPAVVTGTPARDVAPGALRIELHFGAAADLDLYVTDPAKETVYFANTPSVSGGALEADVRCAAATPRIETVFFAEAPPGRYRIGVDYPERCGGNSGPVAFTVRIRGSGIDLRQRGEVGLGEFRVQVLEFEVGSSGDR